jgi:hypothetical protein
LQNKKGEKIASFRCHTKVVFNNQVLVFYEKDGRKFLENLKIL